MLPIKESQILINTSANDPEEAIRKAGELLVKTNSVTVNYVDAMIDNYYKLGPYIVIAPHIAIPHARPEDGVNEQCISFLRLIKPIKFGHPQNDDVLLVMPIGGIESKFHIKMLQDLSQVLSDQKKLDVLMKSNNKKEILSALLSKEV